MVQIGRIGRKKPVFCAARPVTGQAATTGVGHLPRCHDDIGWAIDDGDAASVGLNGYEHRRFLADYYAGVYPMSDARGLVFQENLATGDRRISGTAASLAGIESALNNGDAIHLDLAVRRYCWPKPSWGSASAAVIGR